MSKFYTRGLFACLSLISLGSCQDFDGGFDSDTIKKESYAKDFEKTFGTPDPNQDWSMATLVKANVNLPGLSGTAKMNICTGDPRNADTRLLAQIMLKDGKGSIDFDAIKGMNHVFITVEQNKEYKVFGEYHIVNGILNVGDIDENCSMTRAFSATSPVEKDGSEITTKIAYKELTGEQNLTCSHTSSVMSLDEWKAWSKANVTESNNYSIFKDNTIRHFATIDGIDWGNTTLTLKAGASLNENDQITWDGKAKTFEEWKADVVTNSQPNQYGYNNGNYPFTPASILNHDGTSDGSWYSATEFVWTSPVYKEGSKNCPAGTIITYNGTTKSIDDWKADATANLSTLAGGTYDGPWENSGFLFNKTDVPAGTTGAIYMGLWPESNWQLCDDIEYKDVTVDKYVKFQYLKNIEKSAAAPWTCGEGYSLYGVGAFFEEYKHYYKDPKLSTYGSDPEVQKTVVETIEADFDIITETAGIVSVPFIYGATSNNNQLGYIICDPEEDPLAQTHYVLINDGRPQSNIYRDSWRGDAETETERTSGFTGTSIFDSFVYALRNGTANPYDHKDDPMTCYCSPAYSGIWKEPYGTGVSDGVDNPGTGIYSPALAHGTCNDPMKNYINAYNTPVYGTEYHLSYWDKEKNQFTYTIPAGKRIVFFVLTHSTANSKVGSTYDDGDFTYSLPSLNKRVNRLYGNIESPTFEEGNNVTGHPKARGAVGSVAWKVGETIYMGFGDGGNDEDLNDIVFVVKGGIRTNNLVTLYPINWHMNLNGSHDTNNLDLFFGENKNPGDPYSQPSTNPSRDGYEFLGWATSPNDPPIEGSKDRVVITGTTPERETCYFARWKPINASVVPDPEYISWRFACEDLGGTFDYDFNDVVWEVQKKKVGETITDVKVRILAAGGTLPFTLKYNNNKICTKEEAFGVSSSTVVNAGPNTTSKPVKEYTAVTGISTDWTVSGNIDKFVVVVENSGSSTPIQAYKKDDTLKDKTPQVILLPGTWQWPTETTPISTAYPEFTQWVTNDNYVTWPNPVQGTTVSL